MSLVSSIVSGISSNGVGNITSSFNLDDNTFSDLLEKQMKTSLENKEDNSIKGLGMPPGFQIENLDGSEFSETAQDQIDAIGEKINTENVNTENPFDTNSDGNVTTQEAITFFSSLLDNDSKGQNARSELFDFAKRQAANFYNTYSKNVVTDVKEFVSDIKSMI